jgi:hypothetical protein
MDAEHLRDLGDRFVRLDGLDRYFGLQARMGGSFGFGSLTLLYVQMPTTIQKEGPFGVEFLGSTTLT